MTIKILKPCINACGEGVKIVVERSQDVELAIRWPMPCRSCNDAIKHIHEAGGEDG